MLSYIFPWLLRKAVSGTDSLLKAHLSLGTSLLPEDLFLLFPFLTSSFLGDLVSMSTGCESFLNAC